MRHRKGLAGKAGGDAPANRGRKRGIGKNFTRQLGRLAILWGDIEGLVRTLELMKGCGLTYRAKSDDVLKVEYRAEDWRPFDKHLKAVQPHQTSMTRRILMLKDVRDFALHGAVIKWGNGHGEQDAIMHMDGPATIFAQGGFMSGSLQTIVPMAGMSNHEGNSGPEVLTADALRRAGDDLAGYVYDLRLFRTVFQVREGEEIRMQVAGGQPAPRTPRTIDPEVFENPADIVGHDSRTALRVGEFCLAFSLLDQTVRTLEIMRVNRPGQFCAHTERKVEAWYRESPRQLTPRLNYVLGKDVAATQSLADLVNYRNFIYHNPISMLGTGKNGEGAAFVHRDLVALRDARPRPDAEKNEARRVPDWALARHRGTTHVAVKDLDRLTRQSTRWQERLLGLVGQAHRQARNA